jgi:hypothetical protein
MIRQSSDADARLFAGMHTYRAVAGKLGRFQEEIFTQIETFVPGRDV